MSDTPAKDVRPLYFIAGYPRSGGHWLRAFVYLLAAELSGLPTARRTLDQLDYAVPWDVQGRFYEIVTGRAFNALTEEEMAAARPGVHHLLATDFPGLPVVWTQALRGTFHGHPTINGEVTRGAVYIKRNPVDVAASMVAHFGIEPLRAVGLMVSANLRTRPHAEGAYEPLGSWAQNVLSWTARPDPSVLVLDHDDLVADPQATLQRLSDHMRMGAPKAQVAQVIEDLAILRKGTGERFARRDFRTHLEPVHVRALLEINAELMDAHGYLTKAILEHAGLERDAAIAMAQSRREAIIN